MKVVGAWILKSDFSNNTYQWSKEISTGWEGWGVVCRPEQLLILYFLSAEIIVMLEIWNERWFLLMDVNSVNGWCLVSLSTWMCRWAFTHMENELVSAEMTTGQQREYILLGVLCTSPLLKLVVSLKYWFRQTLWRGSRGAESYNHFAIQEINTTL